MSNKQTKVISPDWTLIAPLPELPPSLSVGQFSFLYSDLRSFKVESACNREAPTPGHSWSPKESHLSVDTAQDCWTLERPAVSAAPEMPTKFSYDVQHFIYLFFGNVQEYHYIEGRISNKNHCPWKVAYSLPSLIWDSPTQGERAHDEAKVFYPSHLVAKHQEENPSRRAGAGEQKLEDPSTPDYLPHSLGKHPLASVSTSQQRWGAKMYTWCFLDDPSNRRWLLAMTLWHTILAQALT